MSLLDTLLDLKKTYNDIMDQIAVFERDRTEMEVIRVQRDEEISQLRSDLAKTRTKIEDNTKLYKAYLTRIKKDDEKIEMYQKAIFDLKREIRKGGKTMEKR